MKEDTAIQVIVLCRSGSHRILQQGLSEKDSRDANSTAVPKCMATSDGKFNICKHSPHGDQQQHKCKYIL